jgi:hypothetical protein
MCMYENIGRATSWYSPITHRVLLRDLSGQVGTHGVLSEQVGTHGVLSEQVGTHGVLLRLSFGTARGTHGGLARARMRVQPSTFSALRTPAPARRGTPRSPTTRRVKPRRRPSGSRTLAFSFYQVNRAGASSATSPSTLQWFTSIPTRPAALPLTHSRCAKAPVRRSNRRPTRTHLRGNTGRGWSTPCRVSTAAVPRCRGSTPQVPSTLSSPGVSTAKA